MKRINSLFSLTAMTVLLIVGCSKVGDLPMYADGKTPMLTASATTVAPPSTDSLKNVLSLSWTNPGYASDSNTFKYVVEMDTAGKGFSMPYTKTVSGVSNVGYTGKELTEMLLARGYAINVPVDMDVRVTSSYANNNERRVSNMLRIKVTPYKVPPRVVLPTSSKLFIVGAATQGGWTNPVPTPTQEFSRLDETTWAGVFQLNGGQSYLLLAVNGMWDLKYGTVGANNSNVAAGDNFKEGGGDLLAPATSGMYKITVDFQLGKFAVSPYTGVLPANLYIVGNATPGGDATGWNNPVPVPTQQFTRKNSVEFEIPTLALNSNKNYLFLPVNGSWTDKFGGVGGNNSNNVNGDELKFNGSDMLSPTTSNGSTANYKINVNFAAGVSVGSSGKFTLTKL